MVAVVEADAGQAAKRVKATDEETPPPPPVGTVRKQRQPTPDHPPYCWMIGEAIDALCENGGSEEDSISAYIRARYPGVPPAHDRFLRHYLDKHVAEGFFVCTAAGRYLRCSEQNTVGEQPVEQAAGGSSKEAFVGSPVVKAKCGRGRPRKDGSSSKSAAGKEDGPPSAMLAEGFFVCTTAGRYLRCSKQNTVGEQPVEQAAGGSSKEAFVGSPVVKAKRGRGRPRKDGSSSKSAAGKEDGPPSAMLKRSGHRRAMVGLAADEDSVPTSPVAVAKKKEGNHDRCLAMAPLATAENSVPASLVAVLDKKDGSQAASTASKPRGRLCKLGMAKGTTDNSGEALVTAKKDGSDVPYTMDKEHEPPRELALVIFGDDSATTSIMDKACSEAPPTTPGEGDQPLELVPVTTTDVPVLPAPTPAMDKGSETINRALVAKNDSICTMSTAPDSSSKACDLALVVAGDISVPVLVADNDGVEEAPSAVYNGVRQPRGSTSTAANKAGSKALSGTPNGCRRRGKLAKVVSPGDCSAFTPVACKKARRKVSFASPKLTPVTAVGCSNPASVADQDSMEAHKLYPVTANEVPDDPAVCLLTLPSLTPRAAAKA